MAAAAAAAAAALAQKKRKAEQDDSMDVQNVFSRYDTDGSGDIDKRELHKALGDLGVECSIKQIDQIMFKFAGDAESMDVIQFNHLVQTLRRARQADKKATFEDNLPWQERVRRFYESRLVTWVFAFCIVGNFLSNVIEKEIDPSSTLYHGVWSQLDVLFNLIFLFELLINMYGSGGPQRPEFYSSFWNVFDTIIVAVGLVLMTGYDFGPFNKLKLMRAFRVLRLGKRIKSLNKMLQALVSSIPGLLNAMLLMMIFFCIYAIIAVEVFRDFGSDGSFVTLDDAGNLTEISSITMRGYTYGEEYYGTFARAMYTLFQVMTGESWSEAVARPLVFGGGNAAFVSFFFISFILLLQIVMLNVAVAVLLDKFVGGTDDEPWTIDANDILNDHVPLEVSSTADPGMREPIGTKPEHGSVFAMLKRQPTAPASLLGRRPAPDSMSFKTPPELSAANYAATRDLNAKMDLMMQQMVELKEQMERLQTRGSDHSAAGDISKGLSSFFSNPWEAKTPEPGASSGVTA